MKTCSLKDAQVGIAWVEVAHIRGLGQGFPPFLIPYLF